jgi:tetratricopeptide (TPR) repeat protein
MKKITTAILVLISSLYFPKFSFAETLTLKSGNTVEGKVLEKTDKYIKIEFQDVPLTYFFDELQSIDGKPVNIKTQTATVEIINPEYAKPPDQKDNLEITPDSSLEDILKKINYFYASHEWDKAIELGKIALTKTSDREAIGNINFSLSSNYLEKGIEPYIKNRDDSFYKLSIEYARKALEVFPESWQILGNLGSVYLNMRDWKQAAYYFSEAEKYMEKNNSSYAAIETSRILAEKMGKEE